MAVTKEIVIKINTDLPEVTKDLIGFNTEGEKTVTTIDDLESSVKGLETALKGADFGTEQYEELRLQLRNAKTELEGLEGGFEAIQIQDRVDSLVKFGEAAVGAFGLAAAGLQAFGADAEQIEKIEKTLLATITAMTSLRAVSEAFSSENIKRFKALRESIAATAVSTRAAAATMKAALISTGIGALVIAVGLLIANWDKVTESVRNYIKRSEDVEKNKEDVEDLTRATRDLGLELDILSAKGYGENILNSKALELEQARIAVILKENILEVEDFYDNLIKKRDKYIRQIEVQSNDSLGLSEEDLAKLNKKIKEVEDLLEVAGDNVEEKIKNYTEKALLGTLTEQEAVEFRNILLPVLEDADIKAFESSLVEIQDIITKSLELRAATIRNENRRISETELAETRRYNKAIYDEQVRAGADEISLLQTKGSNLQSELEQTQAELEKVDVLGGDQEYATKLGEQAYNLKQQILNNEYDIAKTREEIRNDNLERDKKYAEEKAKIDKKAADEELKRLQDLEDKKRDLYQEDFDNYKDGNEQKIALLAAQGADDITILTERNNQILQEENKLNREILRIGDSDVERTKELYRQKTELAQEKAINDVNIAKSASEQIAEDQQLRVDKINIIAQGALDALNMLGDAFAEKSQERINELNEELNLATQNYEEASSRVQEIESQIADARGAERIKLLKDLETQRKAEKKAADEKIALQKLIADEEYKAAKAKYALDLTTAAVSTALAVLNALNTQPFLPLGPIMAGVAGVLGAIQLGIIASNPPKKPTFAQGGILSGPSHSNGGIPVSTPSGTVEAEGGEVIINKRSASLFRNELSDINSYGGYGKKFANGGEIDSAAISNITTASTDAANEALVSAISNLQIYTSIQEVREADSNFTSIEETAEL